jgi:hypothetical protein
MALIMYKAARTLIFGLVASFTLAPAIVSAQTTPPQTVRDFGVDANAPEWCAVTSAGKTPVSAAPGANTVGPIGADLQIQNLVDPTTLSTRAANATIGFEAACNYPHRVTVRSANNGLRRDQGQTSNGVASAVPYTATLTWGDSSIGFLADAQSTIERVETGVTTGAVTGSLVIAIAIEAGATNLGPNRPLGAGQYSDVISIDVGPL